MSEKTKLFVNLGLKLPLINALRDLGYQKPSPIQAACIPKLLAGFDVLGTAQTGSGKTAAFSLPMLHNINPQLIAPQVLVLTPTRELAIQVGEAFKNFTKYLKTIKVVTIYGGQRYDIQLRALRQGRQVIVGTPGRLLDHLKKGTLNLSHLNSIVLDEADEMLRMGFIEDVETILSKVPVKHQTALFSATMPEAIRRITRRFMIKPKEIFIKANLTNCLDIKQSYWRVCKGIKKHEALIRFLEVEDFDAAIIFVKTKITTTEVAEKLEKSGYKSAALNGDMNQTLREKTLEKFKNGSLDILIATDVAARGLDVERITLVVNYDIPIDSESYVHRIGRTGRAGRTGKALLFVENKERRLLRNIEKIIKLNITEISLPTSEILGEKRLSKFIAKIKKQLNSNDLDNYRKLISKIKIAIEPPLDIEKLATILLKIAQENYPLILPVINPNISKNNLKRNFIKKNNKLVNSSYKENKYSHLKRKSKSIIDMDCYRIELGRNDGIEIRQIVGAITNVGKISNHYLGKIKLFDSYSLIELPKKLSNKTLYKLNQIRIMNKLITLKLIVINK